MISSKNIPIQLFSATHAVELFLQATRATSARYINIRIDAEPLSMHIDEGGANFREYSFDPSKAEYQGTVSDLPITKWSIFETVDILITCTNSDFGIYFNGKLVKSIYNWHAPVNSDNTVPVLTMIGWKTSNAAKITKASWTYGKLYR